MSTSFIQVFFSFLFVYNTEYVANTLSFFWLSEKYSKQDGTQDSIRFGQVVKLYLLESSPSNRATDGRPTKVARPIPVGPATRFQTILSGGDDDSDRCDGGDSNCSNRLRPGQTCCKAFGTDYQDLTEFPSFRSTPLYLFPLTRTIVNPQ